MSQRVVFQYNNVSDPYLLIKIYDNETFSNYGTIKYDLDSLENGLPNDINSTIEMANNYLNSKNVVRSEALFLINCSEFFKLTTVIPAANERRASKLYETELARKISDINNYYRYSSSDIIPSGKVFYEFLLPKYIIDFFKGIGDALGFEKMSYDLFPYYLYKTVSVGGNKNYAYYYEEKDIVSMILVINGRLCSYYCFPNTDEACALSLTAIIDKHYYELEKVKVETICVNKNIPYLESYYPKEITCYIGNINYEGKSF